ncbi:MAG: hypothetical protein ACXW61_06730 [Gemmatirosa sp.]
MPDFRLPAVSAAGPHDPPAGSWKDGAVDRTALRDALRRTIAEAAALQARGSRMSTWHFGTADWGEPSEWTSPALLQLLAQLRWIATRYAQARRAARLPIERLLPEVKGVVREVESTEGWHDPADALMAQVVRWTIEAYYDEPALQHVPRFY